MTFRILAVTLFFLFTACAHTQEFTQFENMKQQKWQPQRKPANDAMEIANEAALGEGEERWLPGEKEYFLDAYVSTSPDSVFKKTEFDGQELCKIRVTRMEDGRGFFSVAADIGIQSPPTMYPHSGNFWEGWVYGPRYGWDKDFISEPYHELSNHKYIQEAGFFEARWPFNTDTELFSSLIVNLDPKTGKVVNAVWEIRKGPTNQKWNLMAPQAKVVCAGNLSS